MTNIFGQNIFVLKKKVFIVDGSRWKAGREACDMPQTLKI